MFGYRRWNTQRSGGLIMICLLANPSLTEEQKTKSYLAFLENSLEAQAPEEEDEEEDEEDEDEDDQDDIEPEEGMGGDMDDTSLDETDPNADFQEPLVEV